SICNVLLHQRAFFLDTFHFAIVAGKAEKQLSFFVAIFSICNTSSALCISSIKNAKSLTPAVGNSVAVPVARYFKLYCFSVKACFLCKQNKHTLS
ncbi:MAG: hypothetical protein RSE05_10585, partial [Clostridium sp.]